MAHGFAVAVFYLDGDVVAQIEEGGEVQGGGELCLRAWETRQVGLDLDEGEGVGRRGPLERGLAGAGGVVGVVVRGEGGGVRGGEAGGG